MYNFVVLVDMVNCLCKIDKENVGKGGVDTNKNSSVQSILSPFQWSRLSLVRGAVIRN